MDEDEAGTIIKSTARRYYRRAKHAVFEPGMPLPEGKSCGDLEGREAIRYGCLSRNGIDEPQELESEGWIFYLDHREQFDGREPAYFARSLQNYFKDRTKRYYDHRHSNARILTGQELGLPDTYANPGHERTKEDNAVTYEEGFDKLLYHLRGGRAS